METPTPDMSGTISASELQHLHYPSDIPSLTSNPFSLSSEEDSNMWAPDPTTLSTVNPSCISTGDVNDIQPYLANTQPPHNFADPKLSTNNRRRDPEETQLDQDSTSYRVRHGQFTPPSDYSPKNTFSVPSQAYKQAELQSSTEVVSEGPTKRRRGGGTRARGGSQGSSVRASTSAEPSFPGDDRQEKTRARNRLAASKCRQKKKMQNTQLERKYEYERMRREELTRTVNSLRDAVVEAKNALLAHSECGHESIKTYIERSAKNITDHDKKVDFAVVPTQYYGCGSSDQNSGSVGFEFDFSLPTA
ncbi:hypothetical protein BJX76DRAFT_76739 [Aspergillus varians]